jgi:SAM-dependent methyltransferase
VARREARRRGIEAACRFHLRSYDAPIAPVYDAVVAIEALVHSPGLERTVENLAGGLKPGGKLVVAEDIPPHALDDSSDPNVRQLKEYWNLVDVPAEEAYRVALARSGLRLVRALDLSAYVVARSPAVLKRREAVYAAVRRMLPFAGPRVVVDALIGGLALERLYRRGRMRYRLLVARKHN